MYDWYLKRSEEGIGSSEPQPIMSHYEPKSPAKATNVLCFVLFFFRFFKAGFLCVVLSVLELIP